MLPFGQQFSGGLGLLVGGWLVIRVGHDLAPLRDGLLAGITSRLVDRVGSAVLAQRHFAGDNFWLVLFLSWHRLGQAQDAPGLVGLTPGRRGPLGHRELIGRLIVGHALVVGDNQLADDLGGGRVGALVGGAPGGGVERDGLLAVLGVQ